VSKLYFVIDTDEYSGSFERNLCAYITGMYGECGVGRETAAKAKKELGEPDDTCTVFDSIVVSEPDDHGCWRPVKIYTTPGVYNNGMGFHFKRGDEDTAQKEYKKEWVKRSKSKPYADKQANAGHKKSCIERSKEIFSEYPAYQSVAITLISRPPDEVVELMCNRAREFSRMSRDNDDMRFKFNITGFRFVRERVVLDEEVIDG